ncbi:MAG: hypothetical protein HRU70_02830 [Phycisphaeraceae bacterium]|nr:MAG: hypothetical protein HRU70_02830 [Phycisphaeraceae bacterium]
MKAFISILGVVGLAASASAQLGNPNDLYVYGDTSDNVYQIEPNGNYVGVFSNTGAFNTLGFFGGNNNTFLAGGTGGLREIDGNTGAVIRTLGSGFTYDVQFANNGNIYATKSDGTIKEYDYATGNFIRNVVTGIGGHAALNIRGNVMYTTDNKSGWSNGTRLSQRDANTGAINWTLDTAAFGIFSIQSIRFDSFGNLYVANMYSGQNGIYKLDWNTMTFSLFADNNVPGGGPTGWPGCHGFNFGPDGHLYAAMAGGTVVKYNGQTGAFMGVLWSVNDKLSDVVFKPIPTPGALALLGMGGLLAARRRR